MRLLHLGLCLENQQLIDAKLIRLREQVNLIGLTNLWINGMPLVAPNSIRRRALFRVGKDR